MSNAKYLAFDTPNTKKPLSSGVLNAIIFGINEQCNLKFETSQIVKLILFFYSGGTCFLFFLFFLSFSFSPFFPISHFCFEPPTISLLSLSLSLSRCLCLPLQRNPGRRIKPSQSLLQWFFFWVDFAVVVWVMDLAFLIVVVWVVGRGFGSLIDWLGWGFGPLFF